MIRPCTHCGRDTVLEVPRKVKGRFRMVPMCGRCRQPAYTLFTGDEIRDAATRAETTEDVS